MNRQTFLARAFLAELDETAPNHDVSHVDLLDTVAEAGWILRDDYVQSPDERKLFARDLLEELKSYGHGSISAKAIRLAMEDSGISITQMGLINEASDARLQELGILPRHD